jgi:hypothetical protein
MVQALERFTGPKNLEEFIGSKNSKDVTDWLGTIAADFALTPKEGFAQIQSVKQKIDVTVGYVEVNTENTDFAALKPKFKKMVGRMEHQGLLLKAWQEAQIPEAFATKVETALTEILASPKNVKLKNPPKETKAKNTKGAALKRGSKQGVPEPGGPRNSQNQTTVADENTRLADEAKQNSIIQAFLQRHLKAQIISNMGVDGADGQPLVNRTGTFAGSVDIKVERTPKQRFPAIRYNYEKAPYGVFDDEIGVEPWKNEFRDPRKLIEKSIRELMIRQKLARFTTRRGN